MRKRRNIAFAVLILAVLAALVLSLSACAEKQTKNALEPYSIGWDLSLIHISGGAWVCGNSGLPLVAPGVCDVSQGPVEPF